MSESDEGAAAGQRGRPRRKAPPILIRGTVPEKHALAPLLAGMTPARACNFVLELAQLARLQQASEGNSSSLRLNPSLTRAQSPHEPPVAAEVEEVPFDAIRDLLGFTGVPST